MNNVVNLSAEEAGLLEAFEAGEHVSLFTPQRKAEIEKVAENTFKKDKRINIRLSGRDLAAIQKRALQEGMPYQTLVSSILHKYISGSLQDVTVRKPMLLG